MYIHSHSDIFSKMYISPKVEEAAKITVAV